MGNKLPKIALVCGARPNFMKIAPVMHAIAKKQSLQPFLVHTGQHYDEKMSKSFFDLLNIPKPDIDLEVGSGSHAEQTAKIMVAFEKVCLKEKPDMVVVVGDVNSTLACVIVAKKLWIPAAHIEAGLRSWDMKMPEEINRMVTDSICDLFFTTDPEGNQNLLNSGIKKDQIHFAGNVMIDTLLANVEKSKSSKILAENNLKEKAYALLTMHRPSNVDNKDVLSGILEALNTIQSDIPILFPAHPRTKKMIEEFGLADSFSKMTNIKVCDPLNYHDLLCANNNSKFVVTDSGGLQEETTVLGIPCITIRENTERPVTVSVGSNEVVGVKPENILAAYQKIQQGKWKKGGIPEGWDGKASERIVEVIENYFNN